MSEAAALFVRQGVLFSQEVNMQRSMIGVAAALFLAGCPMASAGDVATTGALEDSGKLSQTDFKALTDARIGVVKAALQLTPEQQQYWPAIEEAIRARAETRYRRLSALEGRSQQRGDADPLALIRERADSLGQRAAGLKKLADAWQPLYQTLTPDQKARMRVVVTRVIGGLREAAEDRRRNLSDDDDDDNEG
ncbi:hypothetical protein J2X36_000793 [Methylobacterium sp. BE186]|uniref:Spy/CpxP family protein refolding chaperone n=1 Tax=Methylobacterium sp. BE186 TaxID=2817715 RepID=UPI00285FBA55|nr:Spy/CpxP family protein refolding chaperone [Methylobacterium sp. BE186]MDR7036057.1 hypothetical protein [Methylobacterium sp. BE186]